MLNQSHNASFHLLSPNPTIKKLRNYVLNWRNCFRSDGLLLLSLYATSAKLKFICIALPLLLFPPWKFRTSIESLLLQNHFYIWLISYYAHPCNLSSSSGSSLDIFSRFQVIVSSCYLLLVVKQIVRTGWTAWEWKHILILIFGCATIAQYVRQHATWLAERERQQSGFERIGEHAQ